MIFPFLIPLPYEKKTSKIFNDFDFDFFFFWAVVAALKMRKDKNAKSRKCEKRKCQKMKKQKDENAKR